jgi:hypothetical protein
MQVELKNVRVVARLSEETRCFTATIHVDGRRVGLVHNRGTGGCHAYAWTDRDAERRFREFAEARPTEHPLEKADQLVDDLVDAHLEARQLAGWCRKGLVFRDQSHRPGQWVTTRLPDTPAHRDHLRARQDAPILEFANDRFR